MSGKTIMRGIHLVCGVLISGIELAVVWALAHAAAVAWGTVGVWSAARLAAATRLVNGGAVALGLLMLAYRITED